MEMHSWSEEKVYFFLRKLGLSHRETDIVKALLVVKSNKQIASLLNIAPSTVHSHKVAIYAKTNTHDRGGLILHLVEKGLYKN